MEKISSLIKIEKGKRHILILLFLTSAVFLIPTNSYAATAPSNTVPESAIKGQPNWSSTSCSLKTQASDAAGSEGLGMILSSDCFINTLTKQSATCTGTQGDGYGSILSCTIVNPDKSTQVTANAQDVLSNTNVTSSTKTNAAGQVISHTQSTSPIDPNAGKNCNLSNIQNCMYAAIAAVALSLLSLAGFILGFVGSLFNWVVVYTVFEFGSYFGNSTGLLVGWGILRDIGNIVLLFAFIFLGVLMILNLESINTRKAIPALLIAALLLNFSLFITEAVIDVSNVISAGLYNQAGNADCTGDNTNTCLNVGISGQIIKATGLADVFTSSNGLGSTSLISQVGTNSFGKMITYISLTIFVVVVIFVLLSAAVLLLIRAITLVFIMVLSPLAFVAMVIPPLADQGKKWQKILIGEAFFAPVYLLLVLVSLKIMYGIESGLNSGSKPQTLLDALGGSGGTGVTSIGSFSVIIIFALIVGFMFAALMTAKSMGAVGATAVTNAATRAVTKTVTAPLRLGAYGAGVGFRTAVGVTAPRLASGYNNMIGAARARGGLTGALAFGVDRLAGGAITGGLQKAQDTSVGGAKSYTDRKKETDTRDKFTGKLGKVALAMDTITKGSAPRKTDESDADYNARVDAAKKAVRDMSQETLETAIEKKGMSHEDLAFIASNVATAKAQKLLDNEHIDDKEKEEFVHNRYAKIAELRKKATDTTRTADKRAASLKELKTETEKLSNDERALMANHNLNEYSALNDIKDTDPDSYGNSVWTEAQIDADIANAKITADTEKLKLKAAKKTEQLDATYANIVKAEAELTAGRGTRADVDVHVDELKKLAASTEKLGKAKANTLLEISKYVALTSKQLKSITAEDKFKNAADTDTFLGNIGKSYSAISSDPKARTEYSYIQNYLATNEVAQSVYGGRRLSDI
jgi:hypothetical protein